MCTGASAVASVESELRRTAEAGQLHDCRQLWRPVQRPQRHRARRRQLQAAKPGAAAMDSCAIHYVRSVVRFICAIKFFVARKH